VNYRLNGTAFNVIQQQDHQDQRLAKYTKAIPSNKKKRTLLYAKSIQQDNFPEEESKEDPLVQAVPGTEISEEGIIIISGQ
jgi:hypothetical protein